MTAVNRIKGSITALITPFRNGALDEDAFCRLVEWQIGQGTHGLVPVGTTGESPTLSHEEHKRVVELCVSTARGRVPVIAGAGSNATREAIELTRHAKEVGADAALSVTPYYNKPTQEGVYRHFASIAEAVDIPIILYNIPGRSTVEISTETMARLAAIANIIGVKDATGNLARASRDRAALPKSFVRLSGDDGTALGFMAHGGQGCISVTSNVAPKLCAEFQNACLAGEYAKALSYQDRLMALHDGLFCEASPAPTKYAASLLGLCDSEVRLPIVPVTAGGRDIVKAAMAAAGLLNS
ncbi:MAG TPA: 4-hydroxy-tetrahydrodipicolinate synthase [Micropepsaceae bacterium]|jgi:4-hydroxy-tetrahydrodipicolinate synthase|nr:4-hydroxy-tetrahydrodipicolinate synthase [Micropepsaceae bacterium]